MLQSKEHSYDSVQFVMERERGFIAVGLFNLKFPVATVSVQDGEHRGFPEGVNTPVHARHWVRIACGDGIQFLIVDAKVYRSVSFWSKHNSRSSV